MKRLHKYFCLSAGERRLLLKAGILVGSIRVALWLIPFKALRRMLAWRIPGDWGRRAAPRSSPNRIARAVLVASRYVPRVTCLVQALAAEELLKKEGHPACLRIGVCRDEQGRFQAHAWVENRGEIVLGGFELARYTQLVAFQPEAEYFSHTAEVKARGSITAPGT